MRLDAGDAVESLSLAGRSGADRNTLEPSGRHRDEGARGSRVVTPLEDGLAEALPRHGVASYRETQGPFGTGRNGD